MSFIVLLGVACGISLSWTEWTHMKHLTTLALQLIQSKDNLRYGREIWKTFAPFILQGAFDEDFPCSVSAGVRANNHYYHPLHKRGLSGSALDSYSSLLLLGDPDVDALTWAEKNADISVKEEFNDGNDWKFKAWGQTANDVDYGDMSWKKAVERYGYTADSKKLAYYTLGFICHLLQDMGCPEHVHDDPHGASGYTGFEMWVYDNWDSLRPFLGSLRPLRLKSLAEFFTHLAKLGYSVDRFQGGVLDPRKGSIARGTDLSRMFKVSYSTLNNEWRLENFSGKRILGLALSSLAARVPNLVFKWNLSNYLRKPLDAKGGDGGEWWPTSMEFPESDYGGDETGYYYLELSGEVPGEPWNVVADPQRNLYPAAFLPTPLPEVAIEASRWRLDDSGGLHLYSLIGRRMFPPIVEHTAGLIEHFYDIVNPPPFVESVQACQRGTCPCSAHFEDRKKSPIGSETVTDVETRKLVNESAGDGSRDFLEPGKATLFITFSEPVTEVAVRIGGRAVNGALADGGEKWSGDFVVEKEGPQEERLKIAISARDLENHYRDVGSLLDADPRTPAKRVVAGDDDYEWLRYEAGEDTRRSIQIKRIKKEDEQLKVISDIDLISGTWAFVRVLEGSKKFHLCRLVLTKTRGVHGYEIRGCHPNESYWELMGRDTILFRHKDGSITSRLTRRRDGYWEGPYIPHKSAPVLPGTTAKPHYIER